MAITAAIVVNPSTANTLQQVAAALTVSNSGSSAVIVTSVAPSENVAGASTQTSGAILLGQPNTGPGMNVTVPAGGTLVLNFSVVPMAPNVGVYTSNPFPSAGVGGVAIVPLQPESQPAQQIYDIGALITTSDGATTSATVAVLTVNSVKN